MSLPPPLVVLSPGDLDASRPERLTRLLAAASRARAAGLAGLLLREPGLDDRAFLELARRLRALFAPPAWLGLHDRAHLAAALEADAVHLGFRSLAPAVLRTWLDPRVALGLSTHAGDDPRSWAAADYLFHGPVYDTPSKRGLVEPIGLDGLVRAKGLSAQPLWALGGITPERVRDVLATGVRGVAVRSALWDAQDAGRATARFLSAAAR